MKTSQVIKEIRKTARNVGLTFKVSNTRLNGALLYKLCNRKTGEVIISNYQLGTAYNDCCSGFISSWDGDKFSQAHCTND